MKQTIRRGVFETNSSSTHSITIQPANSKIEKPKYCDFIYQQGSVNDNFDKLCFIIASNQFELSKIKLLGIKQIFWKVNFVDNEEEYITNKYFNAFEKLFEYKKVTKAIFEEHFGKIAYYKSSYKSYSSHLKLLIKHNLDAYVSTKKELDLSKFKSLRCDGVFVCPYLINDINKSIKMCREQFKLYSLIIDTYQKVTGQSKEKIIESLQNEYKKHCYYDNSYCFTPLCAKFFNHGDLNNECIDCDCFLGDIIKYIAPNCFNFRTDDEKVKFEKSIKLKLLSIFKNKMKIHFFEYL